MLRLGIRTSLIFNTQHVATRRNTVAKRVQHVASNNDAIVWPELANVGATMLGYVTLSCCHRLGGALPSWPAVTELVLLCEFLCEEAIMWRSYDL